MGGKYEVHIRVFFPNTRLSVPYSGQSLFMAMWKFLKVRHLLRNARYTEVYLKCK